MPEPRAGEGKDDFISRCMSDDEAMDDFPRTGQRFAFCNAEWGRSMKIKKAREAKEVQRSLNLPLAPRTREWDADAAESRIRSWAGGDDIDFDKYKRAFFWRDAENPEQFGSYKLGYADVINGELTAIPRGIFAVAAVLQGARGGVNIPSDAQEQIKSVVSNWYKKMRDKFEDDSIMAPWEKEGSKNEEDKVKKNYLCGIYKANDEKQLVSGVVLEPETVDLQGDIISAEEIEKTAHHFLSNSRQMGFRHKRPALAEVVESFIAPTNMTVNGQKIKKGSWIVTAKVHDELLWDAIKTGKIKSFSVGGHANRMEDTHDTEMSKKKRI